VREGGSGVSNVRRADRGSGTVLALGLVGVVLTLGFFLVALGGAQTAHARARSAADLAALAGANALRYGEDGCAVAAATAGRDGAVLDDCADEGGGVLQVAVHHDVGGSTGRVTAWLGDGRARAVARAGPRSAAATTG
jgi:secretion/DNA translocation related TadE-like protein